MQHLTEQLKNIKLNIRELIQKVLETEDEPHTILML